MVRADLLTKLVKFGIQNDNIRFRKVVESVIAEERSKQHYVLSEGLEDILRTTSKTQSSSNVVSLIDPRTNNLFLEIVPRCNLNDLILPNEVYRICRDVVQEQQRVDLLRSFNLEPRNRILLIGPPGNGKTSLAEAVAEALMVPLLIVRYEGVVGAYLGETAVRLRRLIEHASTRRCVLFFDEFETLGKERGDTHETGEIKRVVSSLLMQIDSLPSHVVVIGATNHPELLDRAVWRRFQVRMNLPQPTCERLTKWFEKFEQRINVPLGYAPEILAKKLYGVSFAEAEEFGTTIFRQFVLELPNSNMKSIVKRNLDLWSMRSVRVEQQDEGGEQ
jgi:SpoVK/Ycf46/Vps4 family AAA+-type ATPase